VHLTFQLAPAFKFVRVPPIAMPESGTANFSVTIDEKGGLGDKLGDLLCAMADSNHSSLSVKLLGKVQ